MISDIRKEGYLAGFKRAKTAKEQGQSVKAILKFEINEKEITKKIMEAHKTNRDKSFKLSVIYSFGFDKGVIDAIYE